jgi:hypothetical protein
MTTAYASSYSYTNTAYTDYYTQAATTATAAAVATVSSDICKLIFFKLKIVALKKFNFSFLGFQYVYLVWVYFLYYVGLGYPSFYYPYILSLLLQYIPDSCGGTG